MKKIQIVTLFTLLLALPLFAVAEDEFQEGVHYESISPPQPTTTGDKVEVVQMFWYGCPHCFRFEPYLERWMRKMPANAELVRMPAVFRQNWENHARAYYASEFLGVTDKTHTPLFNAIHMEKKPMETEESLRDFFAGFGVDKIEFTKTFKSFAVQTKVNRSKTMAQRYAVKGVPVFIVNGKYRVSNRTSGGSANTIKVINFLVAKESKK